MKIQPGVGYTFDSSSRGFTLDTSEQFPKHDGAVVDSCYPFKIYMAGAGEEEEEFLFSCCPGTVNSIIPQLGITALEAQRLDQVPTPTTVLNFSAAGYSYIHLKVSYIEGAGGAIVFPVSDQADSKYPRVISNSEQQFATVDSVFYLIATIYKDPETDAITINQFANGSLWADRIQVGSLENIPYYFFARS